MEMKNYLSQIKKIKLKPLQQIESNGRHNTRA
jgi:hypothetical protein